MKLKAAVIFFFIMCFSLLGALTGAFIEKGLGRFEVGELIIGISLVFFGLSCFATFTLGLILALEELKRK